jgi:hypothetical protein
VIRWRRKTDSQSEADQALAEAQAAEQVVESQRARMEPVLDRIQQHVEENAIYAAFKATLRSAR